MYQFKLIDYKQRVSTESKQTVFLMKDSWNDFLYYTLFNMTVIDELGGVHRIGELKIGYVGQKENSHTYKKLKNEFEKIPKGFFSLGMSPEFYSNLMKLGEKSCKNILLQLNDIVCSQSNLLLAQEEEVFKTSLLRTVNINTILGQYKRLLDGDNILTKFDFSFVREGHSYGDMVLKFKVNPFSMPMSNIHAIIGRNGVGKTTLLNEMIESVLLGENGKTYFEDNETLSVIEKNYFSGIISVSFSAFDPFEPLDDQDDPSKGTCYYYLGLKEKHTDKGFILRDINSIRALCIDSILTCFSDKIKKILWLKSMETLESDVNFSDLNIKALATGSKKDIQKRCLDILSKMSSGHTIIFLTLTKIIEKIQDRMLVIMDEPESHLHPPLLSAFIRVLSNILNKRNGVAIIATHSPVVLQEIPKKCTWVLTRFGEVSKYQRPVLETFAENVGLLTKEVFKLEVERSGYHDLLKKSTEVSHSFEDIMSLYEGQIGFEGQILLRNLMLVKNKKNKWGA
ncbi:AAA family ATPase [Klebsiella aerogenes]